MVAFSMIELSAKNFNLFTLRNFLEAQTCRDLIDEARSAPTTRAPVYIRGSEEVIHETIRKTTSFHPADETLARIHERLLAQKSALEAHFGLSLNDCEQPQFLHYEPGDFFVRHQDGNTEQLEFDHLRIRRISVILFLNDYATQPTEHCYSGGALNFYDKDNMPPNGPAPFPFYGETGLLVAFVAETMHEVAAVTSGERFTTITWFR
jgi:SM-20-related protein